MTARKHMYIIPAVTLSALIAGIHAIPDAEARDLRAAASNSRFSRHGAAASGSLSGVKRPAPATAQSQGRVPPSGQAGSISSANQAQRQDAAAANQQARQSTSQSNQAQRQQASNQNVQTRQSGATTRQQARAVYPPPAYRPPAAGYYPPPPPPGYYHHDDDDDWDGGSAAVGFVAGAVVGAVVTDAAKQSAPPPAQSAPAPSSTTVVVTPPAAGVATLPCAPQVTNVNGVTYYRCDQSYYMQAYGSSGPVYMPVQPPK